MPATEQSIMSADEIRGLRKRVGFNQTDFGAVVGVSQMTVSEWERGATTPTGPRAAAMYQWRHRLDQMESREAEHEWTMELLRVALRASLVAVFLKLFNEES
mgnify:CR=1 FL=1